MRLKWLRTALSVILVGMYVAGLVAMFMQRTAVGITLWGISTLGGVGLLWWIHTMDRREADRARIKQGMPYGDPDDPSAPVVPAVPPEDAP